MLDERGFDESVRGAVRSALADGTNPSVVVVELGNDGPSWSGSLGSPEALVVIDRLQGLLRAGDELARMRDDQIAWLLPEAGVEGAVEAVSRARRAISDTGTTLTAGVCDFATAGDAPSLYALADQALVEAKRQGRGTTASYTLGIPEILPSDAGYGARPQPGLSQPTAERARTGRASVTAIGGATTLVGIIGWPVERSLSPRMHNAAFAALGLDWAYVPLPVPPERLMEAVRGLAALGFAGANVTTPHKLAVASLCETDAPSVNTLAVRNGRIEGSSTDAAILEGLPHVNPVVVGDGGAAQAFLEAMPRARRFARRATWPPDASGADLVVNATSVRDEVVVDLGPGQTLVDLPYPETATARAAREGGARVVTGLDVLVAQGAVSFELWTGRPAPVDVMRAALGLPV